MDTFILTLTTVKVMNCNFFDCFHLLSGFFTGTWIQTTTTATSWHGIAFDSTGAYAATVVDGGYIYTTSCATFTSVTDAPTSVPTSSPSLKSCTSWDTWTQTSASSQDYYDVTTDITGQFIYAVVNPGLIYKSTDYGVSWSSIGTSSPGIQPYSSIAIDSSGQYVFVSVNSGFIYVSDDFGTTFFESATDTPNAGDEKWATITASSTGQYVSATVTTGGYIFINSNYGQGI